MFDFSKKLEYRLMDNFTEEQYLVLPVWDALYEDWSEEYQVYLIKNGICRIATSVFVTPLMLEEAFPSDQYTLLESGQCLQSKYRLRFT